MKLFLINNDYKYELEKLIRIFLPFEKIEISNDFVPSDSYACVSLLKDGTEARSIVKIGDKQSEKILSIDKSQENLEKEEELKLAVTLFKCFKEITGYNSSWGILTGVRPAKLFSKLQKDMGEEKAGEYFKNSLCVDEKKISLCKATVLGEGKIISLSKRNSFSLYVSIPFCPSRCSYCSFVSHSIQSAKKLIPKYVDLLCEELKYTAEIAKNLNLRLETVYIGGGTPTSVSAENLGQIMECINREFDISSLREFTVEAGRPDTITEEKLKVIKRLGATRISINPQTMNNSVLKAIGRNHTSEEAVKAFELARKVGFDNINTDLIAGLPTDTFESFKETVNKILALNPESVTVHSLSMKRSSALNKEGLFPEKETGNIASYMVDYAREELGKKGIVPYYMYRQSKTVGNLENVGYAKEGYECLYNVYIMDETHSILACGASAVTKLREPDGSFIERIFNYKYPYEYIDRFDEIIMRKKGIGDFYDKFGNTN